MMNLHIEFRLKMSMHDRDNEWKSRINRNILSPRGHNSAKNYSTGTKLELDLHILLINLHTEFQHKMSMHDRDNERKLNDDGRTE